MRKFVLFTTLFMLFSTTENAAASHVKPKNPNATLKKIKTIVNEFQPNLGIPKNLSYESLKVSRKKNSKYCDLGVWSIHFPKQDIGVIKSFATTIGDSLYNHRQNTDEFGAFIFRRMLQGVKNNNLNPLKIAFLLAIKNEAFTTLKASTFTDAPRGYPMFGEPKMLAHSALLTMTLSYAVLAEELTVKETEMFKNWGKKFFYNMTEYDDKVSSLSRILEGYGPDRVSIKIMAMAAWGTIMKDRIIFDKALKWYLAALEQIDENGFHNHFIQGHRTKEIKYHNDTYGALSVAAYFFEITGFPALDYKNSNSSSLLDGLDLVFRYLDGKSIPRNLPEPQKLSQIMYHSRSNYGTIAYAEYIQLLRPEGISDSFNKILQKMRNTGRIPKSQSRDGLYSVIHGGYTTCLLALDIRTNQN